MVQKNAFNSNGEISMAISIADVAKAQNECLQSIFKNILSNSKLIEDELYWKKDWVVFISHSKVCLATRGIIDDIGCVVVFDLNCRINVSEKDSVNILVNRVKEYKCFVLTKKVFYENDKVFQIWLCDENETPLKLSYENGIYLDDYSFVADIKNMKIEPTIFM